jgi:PhzF family phenazine biosynthesis protein
MQALAAENNQAETAYLLKTADPARFGLRWFTPALEAPLCGHATLAAPTCCSRSWASTSRC